MVYGTEAGIFRKTLGVPTVVCGPGDIAQAHQPNEYLLASQIDACEGFMRRMVEWACRDLSYLAARPGSLLDPRISPSGIGLKFSSRAVWAIRYCGWKR